MKSDQLLMPFSLCKRQYCFFLQRPNQIKTHNVDYFKKSFFSSQFQLEYNYCYTPHCQGSFTPSPKKPHTQQEGHKIKQRINILCHLILKKIRATLLLYFTTKNNSLFLSIFLTKFFFCGLSVNQGCNHTNHYGYLSSINRFN
jgi:hypothetical protein